ncbi:MAG: LuxR C-terminal-related transcriptional regulator [Alphaproteobacteria bacterium]|jgi:hypothetical protein|nr:LuxR C-terminal-related transcriptional regulator [Alphaproteobacteria bacterium]
MDISRFPYFSYQDLLDPLLKPINSSANIKFVGFKRGYPNREQFIITGKQYYLINFYSKELYRYGYFENDTRDYESGFHLWDHLPYDRSRYVYQYIRNNYNFAHGLTITQQHEAYCDFFIFTTDSSNGEINNFYINKKNLFEDFIKNFYQNFHQVFDQLDHHKFILPSDSRINKNIIDPLTPRQRECGILMIEGRTTKEIAKTLNISHRTVEEYINILKSKFDAKTRAQLSYDLRQYL